MLVYCNMFGNGHGIIGIPSKLHSMNIQCSSFRHIQYSLPSIYCLLWYYAYMYICRCWWHWWSSLTVYLFTTYVGGWGRPLGSDMSLWKTRRMASLIRWGAPMDWFVSPWVCTYMERYEITLCTRDDVHQSGFPGFDLTILSPDWIQKFIPRLPETLTLIILICGVFGGCIICHLPMYTVTES